MLAWPIMATLIYIYTYIQLSWIVPAQPLIPVQCTGVRHPPTSESHTATNKQSDKILFLSFLFYCFLLTSTK